MKNYPDDSLKLLVAACGINCRVCSAHLRKKNQCVGCRIEGNKPNHCNICAIAHCPNLDSETGLCGNCDEFPCRRMKNIDKRYRLKYYTSLIGNLNAIRTNGIDAFLESEQKRWRCTYCGGTISVHTGSCVDCLKHAPNKDHE